jgi:uroporphyrin-III C-methyltransferase/precorrin-2 dehydrogenase/sirohydrochlorin ferrochelatase
VDYLPIFYDIRGKHCLVVGGGAVAARKVALIKQAGAQVTVVAPELGHELAAVLQAHEIDYVQRAFQDEDLSDCALVVGATDDPAANKRVSELAKAHHIPVNVVDRPKLCSFILPSIVDRSPVQIAVSTGGASPVLARLLRSRLENCTPAAYGRLAKLVEDFRGRVKLRFSAIEQRRSFWEQVLQGPVAEMVFAGRDNEARELLQEAIDEADEIPDFCGEVYLVGAGPGDPDLLTFRALRLMQQADVVVYDRLVAPPILELVRRDAERIYAGKQRSNHAIPQETINQMLVRLAKEGKRVLRLKGGDPFVFGRGGEEIATLIEERVPFQVVPGITAATGCAAYAGIPLTHRDYAQACVFVTGHLKDGSIDLNWDMLAHRQQTIVFYMGLHGVKLICNQLVQHGLPSATPAALITKGTTPEQRVLIGDLETLPNLISENDIKPPTLIIVGEVVKLHEKMRWFRPGAEIEAQAITIYGNGRP